MESRPGALYFAARPAMAASFPPRMRPPGEIDADPVEAGLFLRMNAEVIGLLVLEFREIGVRLDGEADAVLDLLGDALDAPIGDEELEPGAVALEAVTFVAEELTDGLDDGPDLMRLDEEGKRLRKMRGGGEAAAHHDAVAGLRPAAQAEDADAIDVRLGAPDAAPGDGDFVFAREIREIGVVGHVPVDLEHLLVAIDDLLGIDAGDGAADDVAGIIAAGAAGGDADGLEGGEDFRDILDAQPMHLDGLAGGDIGEAVGVLVGDLRDDAGLGGGELAAGDLGPEHEVAGILGFLAVDAVPLEALEIAVGDGGEAALRVAVDIVDDGETVFFLLQLLLRGERDEAALHGGEIGMDFDHGTEGVGWKICTRTGLDASRIDGNGLAGEVRGERLIRGKSGG